MGDAEGHAVEWNRPDTERQLLSIMNLLILASLIKTHQNRETRGERNKKRLVRGYQVSIRRWICSGNLMNSMMTIIINYVLHIWNSFRLAQVFSAPGKKELHEMMYVLISLWRGEWWLLQYTHISTFPTAYLQCMHFICQSHSNKYGGKGKGFESIFLQRRLQMANKHTKTCPSSQSLREMWIKSTVKIQFTALRVAVMKLKKKCWWECERKKKKGTLFWCSYEMIQWL